MNDQTAPERPRTLVLASTSRYRRALLDRLGLPFLVVAPPYDEEQELPLTPPALVVELARRKAESVAPMHPDALILGCDQVAALGDDLIGKPGTKDRAVEQLLRLAGRTHRLLTGVALLDARTGETVTALSSHEMTMRAFGRSEAVRYVEMDAPVDCAGAYRVESLGVALFETMVGDDHTGIVGLPLTRVVTLLERHGIRVLQQ